MSFLGDFANGLSSSLRKKPSGRGILSGNWLDPKSEIPSIEGEFDKPLDIPKSEIPGIQPTGERAEGMASNIMGVGQDLLAQKFPVAYKVAQALAKIESSNNYGAVGPTVKGNNAYGKYQIMEQNVPSWGKEATGQNVTLQEFRSNHDLQDRIAVYKINALLEKGHSPDDVASIWLSGRPLKGNNRKDLATGVSVPSYVNNFRKAYSA